MTTTQRGLRLFSSSARVLAAAASSAPPKSPVSEAVKKIRLVSPTVPPRTTTPTEKEIRPKPSNPRPTQTLAQEFRKRAPKITETYVAYANTDILVRECAKQASYSLPQSRGHGVGPSQSKDGEDLGVGTGWWYEGMQVGRRTCLTY